MSKANNLVAVDFESYYDSEYSLSKMSMRNYLHDSRFNAYLVAVYDGESINYTGAPEQFDWSLLDGMTICAHNASFDEAVYKRLVELKKVARPVKGCTWACTADLAAWLGVKRDLATASQYLLGETLSKSVREEMKGRSAEDCLADNDVIKYGNKDAVTCYRLADRYFKDWPEKERRVSVLNREAGFRGMALDVPLVLAGIRTLAPKLAQAEAALPWVSQGEKPLSPNALKAYGASVGIPVPASLAKTSEDFINWVSLYGDKYPWVRAAGEYRSINTLLLRVKALRDGRDPKTNRFPYALKYFGASTGRFAGGGGEGAGRFNVQNMPRKAMFGVDVRPMFIAKPGYVLLIADYNQVEARYLLWRAGDEPTLELIRAGRSVYQAYAETNGLAASGSNLKHDDPSMYQFAKACLTEETLVLTNHGFKRIVDVVLKDQVWDGQSWVSHQGVVCNGYRNDCVSINGERFTSDHELFSSGTASILAGDVCKGGEALLLAWRMSTSPGTDRDGFWTLANRVFSILAREGRIAFGVRVSLLRKTLLARVAQCKSGAYNALHALWSTSRYKDPTSSDVG